MLRNSFLLLDGVGEKTEQRIWKQGITSWQKFMEEDNVPGVSDARKEKHASTLEKAARNLEKQNRAFFNHRMPNSHHWRLYREFQGSVAYLDIETTGLDAKRNKVTTVSFYDGDGCRTFVHGNDLTEDALAEEIKKHSVLVTFNGKRFDIPFLQTSFPGLDFEHPHIDLMYECRKIGLSGGLKSIEKQLGLGRGDVDGVDGREAIRLWRKYERGNQEALDRLVKYNQKDVRNLEPLLDEVYNRLTERTFRRVIP